MDYKGRRLVHSSLAAATPHVTHLWRDNAPINDDDTVNVFVERFVPHTVSYDGDPFDGLVLGPPLEGGRMVRGVIVGLMLMEDEKDLDSKVDRVHDSSARLLRTRP